MEGNKRSTISLGATVGVHLTRSKGCICKSLFKMGLRFLTVPHTGHCALRELLKDAICRFCRAEEETDIFNALSS